MSDRYTIDHEGGICGPSGFMTTRETAAELNRIDAKCDALIAPAKKALEFVRRGHSRPVVRRRDPRLIPDSSLHFLALRGGAHKASPLFC